MAMTGLAAYKAREGRRKVKVVGCMKVEREEVEAVRRRQQVMARSLWLF
jgi:hypothetical protein